MCSLLRAQALFGKLRSHKQHGTAGKKKLFKENTQDSLQIFLPASSQLYVLTDMLVVDEPITNQPPCAGTPSLRGVGAQHPEVP